MIKTFFKNTVFLFLVEFIVRLKAVVLIPLLTHHLGATEYGLWSQVAVLVAVLSPLVTLGTDSAITRFLPGIADQEARARYSGWIVFVMVTSLASAILLHVTRGAFSAAFFGDTSGLMPFVSLAAISLVGMIANNCLRLWYRICNRSRAFGIATAVQSLIGLAAVVAAVINGADPFKVISWPIYGDLLIALILALRFRAEHVWTTPTWAGFHQILKFGLIVLPSGFAVWGLNYIDRIFLVQFTSLGEVGVYALAFSLASIVIQFATGPIWSMYYTSAAELHNQGRKVELQRLFDRSIEIICLITAPIIAALAFYGKEVLSLLSTSNFVHGAPVMPIVALGYVLMMFSSYFETSLSLHDKVRVGTIAAITALAFKIILNTFLIEPFGIFGAAISSISAFCVQLAITCGTCVSNGYIRCTPRYGILTYVYAFTSYAIPWSVLNYWIQSYDLLLTAVSICAATMIYLIAVLQAGGLHPEIRGQLNFKIRQYISSKGKWL